MLEQRLPPFRTEPGYFLERRGVAGFRAPLPVTQSFVLIWPQLTGLVAATILIFAIAYVLWQRALEEPQGRRLALWAGASILAVLTHYFTAFLFVPEALILIRRLGWRRLWAPIGAVDGGVSEAELLSAVIWLEFESLMGPLSAAESSDRRGFLLFLPMPLVVRSVGTVLEV